MTETATGGRIVPLRHPRLDRGSRHSKPVRTSPLPVIPSSSGDSVGPLAGREESPFGVELPAAPSRRRPHIPAAVPKSETSQHQENLQLPLLILTLALTAYLSAIYILRHEPFRHYHIIQLAGTNKNTSFVVGGSSCVRLLAIMYSTGTSSSQLGTISPDFLLNLNLKFAVGNKKPRLCTQSEPQARS